MKEEFKELGLTRPPSSRLHRWRGPTPAQILGEGLSDWFGRPVRVVALRGHRSRRQSTHPIDRLDVTLDSGERLPVIFKRPGWRRPGAAGRPAGPRDGRDGRREVLVYRRFLAGRRFGAPALYASAFDPGRKRYWLFLEDVGRRLLEHGDEAAWLAAVRWLAEMHGTYAGRTEELRALGCLDEHGPEFYRRLADGARQSLQQAGSPGPALARFDRLMARYEAVVADLAHQPRTLVHGDVFPHNVLVQPPPAGRARAEPRVRPIDWESAAVGLGALDLARLLDGWGPRTPALVDAYLTEFARHAATPPDRAAFGATFARCAILNVLWNLGCEPADCRHLSFVDPLLDELEHIGRLLDTEAGTASSTPGAALAEG